MTVARVLKQARDLYDQAPSHAPVGRSPDRGSYCVLSAITEVALQEQRQRGLNSFPRAVIVQAVAAMMRVSTAAGFDSTVEWNAVSTTGEVLSGFEQAAREEAA